jgi:hypothetical protein
MYPELRTKFDDDGLLYLDDGFRLSDNGIAYKDHILHYHQFLRRGFSSNPNFDFLGKFIRYYYDSKGKNQFRIAIDHRRIMPKEFFRQQGEKDAWYGPRFDRSRLDDPRAVGLTVIANNLPEGHRWLFPDLERTEFYWKHDDGIKTFEVEELSGRSNLLDSYYLNRYVHSERDIRRMVLRHFDGAVKVYTHDSYENRLSARMPRAPKSFKKIKVFRIDGDIPIDEWIELISFFYKGNLMITEYFDPEQYAAILRDVLGLRDT